MSLKQSIVVVNEYTIRNNSSKGGSRGGSPGDYVLRYMARNDATEISTPVRVSTEDYIQRYMARKEATESLELEDEHKVRRHMAKHQKLGGVAFGNKGISLSHNEIMSSSKGIQQAFDQGKTVMKTVISFDEDYLRENGIISDDFVFEKKGDYRGNIDQIKLRYAIMNGIEYLSHDYDDLQYVGVIQVDTAHVHCHLAMVDMGNGNITPDGTQKGKISANSIAKLRRGIDLALDESKEVQFMASNVDIDKRNIQTNMRKYTYRQVTMYGAPQKIMSVLPEDESLWRASTHRKEMKQANKICRDYVEGILAKSGSGMEHAMQSVYDYVDARDAREDLSLEEKQKLIRNGREDIVQSCMNSVYMTLRQIPKEKRTVSNDFLNLTSSPMITPSFDGSVQDFVYKMNSYGNRLKKHKSEAKKYTELKNEYETAIANSSSVAPESQPLYDYFRIEEEYQEKLTSKYSHFLFFEEPSDDLTDEYFKVSKEAETLNSMEQLFNDKSARQMKPENAEIYGRERYGVYGGKLVVIDRNAFEDRIDKYRKVYEHDNEAFESKLRSENLTVMTDDNGNKYFGKKIAHDFEDVKGLDLHNLRGDFSKPLEFSGDVRKAFVDMATKRIEAYDKACEYLDMSGQGSLKQVFDNEDVENMRYILNLIEANKPVEPLSQPQMVIENKKVIPLDGSMHKYISDIVKNNVVSIEYAESMNLGKEY